MALDLEFVRSQFPAFSEASLVGWRFFENAGGSYACAQTIESLTRYYRETKVQPYGPYPASARAGAQMDASRAAWAQALGVETDEVVFTPSASATTYVLANALRRAGIAPGDEIIVTNQDHEANSGAWRRLEEAGATIREWRVDSQTGMLRLEDLDALLTSRTRVVCAPAASNVVGYENDVRAIADRAHAAGAWCVIDAVSYAPHQIPDLQAMGADALFFSLYKVYGVHQGVLAIRRAMREALANEAHFFNAGYADKRLNPAGPDHAQVAAAGAVLDYVAALDAHHGGGEGGIFGAARRVSALWREQENAILPPLLDFLRRHPRARILGPDSAEGGRRAPTVAVVTEREPAAVAAALVDHKIMAGAGDFYARRVIEALGVDPARGVLRLSFVHYTAADDIAALTDALDAVL